MRWPSLPAVEHYLQEVRAGDPEIRSFRLEAPEATPSASASEFIFGPDRASLGFAGAGRISMDRSEAAVTIATDEAITDAGLVHPYLGLPAAVFNRWAGRDSFHAGALVVGGRAIIVAGHKEGGKSTTMAFLAGQGLAILADDLVVLDGGQVLPGPRCVDLRPEAAAHLGIGEPLGVIGARDRWRIHLDPVAPHELGGIVYLGWGARPELVPLAPGARLQRLFEFDSLGLGPTDPSTYLDLARVPAWEFNRPRGIESMPRSCERMLAMIG